MTEQMGNLEDVLARVLAENVPYLTPNYRTHLSSLQAEAVMEWLERYLP